MDAAFTRRVLTVLAISVVILSLLSTAALADELYARVRGTVTDSSGAVVPGVTLRITNVGTNTTKTTTSAADGTYEFINLIAGVYTISATKTGYATTTVGDVKLAQNQIFVSPVTMKVGAVTEEVTVYANPAQVEQTSMQLTATISEKTITDLPLNGRNWVTLQQTLPGVVIPDTRFTTSYSTNGSQGQQNSYLINGSDANDLPLNTPLAPPNPDAISEVKMITNTINPEYGRNSGAIMNAVTKSGTNQFHGTLFEFFRDTSLNDANFFQTSFNTTTGVLKKTPSKFHQHQYGGTVGGPIIKNKTFFFFSLQNTRNAAPSANLPTANPTVFSAAQRAGIFSAATIASKGKTNPFPIVGEDGTTYPAGTPWKTIFPTGHVPVADFSAFSNSLVQKFVPLPTSGNSFPWVASAKGRTNQYLGRLDHNLGTKDAFWFYGYANNANTVDDAPFQTGATLPGFGSQSFAATKQFTASWSHTLNTNMLNEFRLGYTRLNFLAVFPQQILDPATVGFPTIHPQIAVGSTWPEMTVTGYFNLGFSTNGPQPRKDQTYQITDNFSWVKGRHSLKMGYEGRKFQVWNPFGARNSGAFTFATSGRYTTGDPGLDFLLGIPSSYNQQSGSVIIGRAYEHYFYLQDQWRIRDNLTITLGTGYQIDTPIAELQNNGISRVCFIPGQHSKIYPGGPTGYNWPGDPGCNTSGGAVTKYTHFGPRVGFAYSPNWGRISGAPGKMSFRGGIGVYYNRGEEELNLQDLGDPPIGASSNGAGGLVGGNPSFPDPFKDIKTGATIANPFPYTAPPVGTTTDFTDQFPVGGGFNTINKNFTVPRAVNYNLTLERELPGATIMRIGYVGAIARHLVTAYTFNPVTPAGLAACLHDPANGTKAGGCADDPDNQAVNFPDHFTYGGVFGSSGQIYTNGTSNYNSLQVTVDKHLSHGLQMLGTYTWSHALDVGSSFEDTAFLSAGGFDPNGHLKRDYGDAAFDTRHRFTISGSYDIPNLNKLSPFSWMPSRIFGGWRVTGINAWQTGQPINLQDSNDLSLQCSGNYSFYSCPDRPDLATLVKVDQKTAQFTSASVACNLALPATDPGFKSGCNKAYFFTPNSFTDNAVGTLGNVRRGFLHGPGFWNIDFALQKDTKVTEGTAIQIRVEGFNLLNHTNFANPQGNAANLANFGRSTTIRNKGDGTTARLWQLGAKFIF
jgi:Carboxypeptidase regulatory-like domain